MGLIREDMTIQDFNVLIQTAAGIQELWDGYSSSVKECHELKEALAEERCARVDTDGRCKGLYESLRKEKETNAELRSKIRLLEASLAQAESAVAGLEKAMAEKDASLERLFKMCFGKKSESLEHVLGKKACRELRAALCPGAGQGGTPHDGETNGACAEGSGVAPHGGMEEASGEGTPAPAKGDGNGTSEGAAPGACQDSTGGKPDGKMAGAGKGNGKRGKILHRGEEHGAERFLQLGAEGGVEQGGGPFHGVVLHDRADLVVIFVLLDVKLVHGVDGVAHLGEGGVGDELQLHREIVLAGLQDLVHAFGVLHAGDHVLRDGLDLLQRDAAVGQF